MFLLKRFLWSDLIEIFKEEKEIFSNRKISIPYTEPQFQFILQLMLKYRLCQKNPFHENGYLIPSAFGKNATKDYESIKTGGRHYRFQFESPFEMLIMYRFIAENILLIAGNDYGFLILMIGLNLRKIICLNVVLNGRA